MERKLNRKIELPLSIILWYIAISLILVGTWFLGGFTLGIIESFGVAS